MGRVDRPVPRTVVWITTDHLRFDSIAANGNPAAITPHMDRLVREGISLLRPRNDPNQEFAYVVEAPWEASSSGWTATIADNFLSQRHRRHQKQFLHLGFYAPHPPLNPTPEMLAPYDGAELPPLRYGEQEWLDKPAPFGR